MNFIPRKSQQIGIKLFLQKSFAGLFWPPGLGKTAVVLMAFDILRKKKMVKNMIIISTIKIIGNTWPREIEKWTPHLSYAMIRGGAEKRIEALNCGADILLMNMENTVWLHTQLKKKKLIDVLVVDESSKFRNPSSKRFRAVKKLLPGFTRRYILTGSPAPKSLINLWSQLFIVDRGCSLGDKISHFRSKYFHPSGFQGYDWEIKKGADEEIYERVAERISRFGDGELKLPPLVPNIVPCYLDDEARLLYDEMEKEYIIEIEGEEITAENAGVKTGKLRQLANGRVYGANEKGKKRKQYLIHSEKAFAVQELLEETQGTPALIGYEFHSDLDALIEVLGKDSPVLKGGMKDDESNDIIDRWNAGEFPYVLCQMNTVSHGLNLQDTHASVIYYTIPYDLEVYEQFYRRVWRSGQKATVMLYHIMVENSIDDSAKESIEKKDKRQQKLLNGLERYIMARKKKFTRAETIVSVGNKEGMCIIAEFIKEHNKDPVPRLKFDVKDPGGVLLSLVHKRASSWSPSQLEEFCKLMTKNTMYDGKATVKVVKDMISEVFCADVEKPITPETYKMWPIGAEPREKKVATNKSMFAASTKKVKGSKKKAPSKKAASKKKVSSKKVSKKAASKKKVSEKKVGKGLDPGTILVAGEGMPKMDSRAGIVEIVAKSKGKGMKLSSLLEECEKKLSMKPSRAEGHIKACMQRGFIDRK